MPVESRHAALRAKQHGVVTLLGQVLEKSCQRPRHTIDLGKPVLCIEAEG